MKRLSLEDLRNSKPAVTFVDTQYGGQVGIRRMSVRAASELQKMAKAAEASPDLLAFGRALLLAAVVEPPLDEASITALEEDAGAFNDLITKILDHNGMTEDAQKRSARDFRAGDEQPGGVPARG